VNILCFINLLIFCLEVEVTKRLLWPLNELAALFKSGENCKEWPSNYGFNSSYNFRAREKFIRSNFFFKH